MNAIIYTHPSILEPLVEAPLRDLVRALLVEVAPEPSLTVTLGLDTPVAFPGIAGILGGQVALDDLKVEHPGLPAPIVLGPGKRLSPHLMSAAVARLDESERRREVTLLLHLDDVAALGRALARVDRIALAVDTADHPGESLPELAEFLAREELLGGWDGLFLYTGVGRPAQPDVAAHLESMFSQPSR
jgi:hypothetical protein